MPLSETSNDLDDDERKMDLVDLDFCSFLDGDCNDNLEGDETGFSTSKSVAQRDRPAAWRYSRSSNNLGYSLMTNYEDNGDGIEMDGKQVADATFGSGGSASSIRSDQQAPKSLDDFQGLNEQENRESTAQQPNPDASSNGPLHSTNQLDVSSSGHAFRPNVSTQLHPQAIQSSAACPPHDALNMTQAAYNTLAAAWGANPFMLNMTVGTQAASEQQGVVKDSSAHSYFSNEKSLPMNPNTSVELYANFLASQKTHQAINSFAYEMPIHGFDPNQGNTGSAKAAVNFNTKNKGVKNAKEQKRAQQITNLIEQLRVMMEKDGWKVEVNSKFHTLSSCAKYLKHMKNANEDKERAIREVKNKLEAKRLRVEDESAQQERSEPESTFSDLTDSSMSAKIRKVDAAVAEGHDVKLSNAKSRKMQHFTVSHQSTLSSSGSSGADNEAKTAITDPTVSSLSESTLSKKIDLNGDNVVGGSDGNMSSSTFAGNFELDFEEVFIKSNIPQLLAANSGKIVAWNAFFLEITGLEPKEVQRLTIFSLVPARELAKLFEFVADALRAASLRCTPKENSNEVNDSSITLPCVSFPRVSNGESPSRPLFMTVTMMNDSDPPKRSFHVVFSDQSGSNGTMGSISKDLLALLFARPHGSNPLRPKSLRKTHKKRKQCS